MREWSLEWEAEKAHSQEEAKMKVNKRVWKFLEAE